MSSVDSNTSKKLKIAIFSGAIPAPSFIEHLIESIANHHHVLLFGTINKHVKYSNKSIKIYGTHKNQLINFFNTIFRSVLLLVKRPLDFLSLLNEIKKFKSTYNRWVKYSKFLPIVLHQPDILHLQWAKDIEFYDCFKQIFGIKVVVSFLGTHINISPIIDRRLHEVYLDKLNKIDGYHSVSQSLIDSVKAYNLDREKIVHITTLLNKDLFTYYKPIESIKTVVKIVSVGRYHWVKGYEYALKAMYNLKDKNIEFHYTIIAQGHIPENIKFLIKALDLESHVTLISGITPQEKLFQEMSKFDVLLLPSLSEGIANVVLEAMCIGIPVVSTDCGGMSEVVIPNKTGWLVPVRNPDAITDAIIEIKNTDNTQLQNITHKAFQLVKANFNYTNNSIAFLKFYKDVMDRDSANKP